MKEKDHLARPPQDSPQALNRELKGIFNLLPDYNIFMADEGTYREDLSIGRLVDTRTPEQFKQDFDNLEAQLRRRSRSEMRLTLKRRLSSLLGMSQLTTSARVYIERKFDKMTVVGIEREEYEELPFATELQVYARMFQWDNPFSGGIFDPEQAPEIDRKLYLGAAESLIARERIGRAIEEDEVLRELRKEAEEAGREYKEREKTVSPEERSTMQKDEERAEALVNNILQRQKEEEELVRAWRNEYIQRYGDEP